MKRIKGIFTLVLALGAITGLQAQHEDHEPCGYDQVIELLEQQYPGFRKTYDGDYKELLQPRLVQNRKIRVHDTLYFYDTVYTIPVVFHVLWNTSAENIHDSLLYSQLEVLNRDFRRLNPDTSKTRNIFKSRTGDSRIQFELATIDPNGNATSGIERVYTSRTTFYTTYRTEMKSSSQGGADAWNPQKYLNIWICDLSYNGFDALLGFAYPPYGHPFWDAQYWISDPNQGVVLHYKVTGRNNPLAVGGALWASRHGRTAVHEVGHYFGLRHIWGDGSPGTGCSVDDFIDDTPNQGTKSNFDCNLFSNTCTDPGTTQYPDMVENYMDYSSQDCQNMFTNQQIMVMRNSVAAYRYNLPSKMEIIQRQVIVDSFQYNEFIMFAGKNQTLVVEMPNSALKSGVTLDAWDMSGNRVMQDISLSANETAVSTAKLAPGTYIFNLKDPGNHSLLRQKILILKN